MRFGTEKNGSRNFQFFENKVTIYHSRRGGGEGIAKKVKQL